MQECARRFLPAISLVVLIVTSAPFVGLVRDFLFERFQASAVRSLALILLAVAVAVFLYAVVRIRHQRGWRYTGLALAAALLWIESAFLSADLRSAGFAAQASVAEKSHLVEFGLLAILLYRACKPFGDLSVLIVPLLAVVVAGVLDETMQWAVETRTGDVHDVFLNLYAGVFGLVFGLSLDPPRGLARRLVGSGRRRVATAAALALAALGLFFDAAHLGYEHSDEEVGRFRSWHTLEELREAAADRVHRWQADPPKALSPWKLEDSYLTEAGWYANHRNERYGAGDAYMAWQASRIPEQYYAPFLDLESFRGSGKHRYPLEIRRQLEAEARVRARDAGAYSSPVLTHRIYPWPPRGLFFAVLAIAVVLVAFSPRWGSR